MGNKMARKAVTFFFPVDVWEMRKRRGEGRGGGGGRLVGRSVVRRGGWVSPDLMVQTPRVRLAIVGKLWCPLFAQAESRCRDNSLCTQSISSSIERCLVSEEGLTQGVGKAS